MNNSTISCHQLGILASVLLLTLKFTSLPALFFETNGVGGVISISLIVILNIVFVLFLVWIKTKFKVAGFYEILCEYLGKFVAKAVYALFFLFFIFKFLSLLSDGFGFIRDVADEEFTIFSFLICFIPVCCALANSGIRNIGRTAEFFFPYIIVGLAISILLSFVPVDIFGVGTQIKGSFSGLLNSLTNFAFWNGDVFAILFFLDRFTIKKCEIKNILIPFVITSVLLVSTYIVYYSLYQQTSIFHNNMLYDIVQYAIGTSSGWHMDIFAIIVFMICIIIQGGIFMLCAVQCLKNIFNFDNKALLFTSVVLVLVFGDFLFLDDYFEYVVYARTYLSIFALILLFGVFVLLGIFTLFKASKKVKGGKNARSQSLS